MSGQDASFAYLLEPLPYVSGSCTGGSTGGRGGGGFR